MLNILIVSDASGETAERMVRSALVQFADAPTQISRRGQIRSAEDVCRVVQDAAAQKALLVHTLVSDELRRLMLEEARLQDVDAMDLMGSMLDRLASRLNVTPLEQPGLFKQLADARSREIEAVEFAFYHDDGQHPDELSRAEIVVLGVSRTMKTPMSLYLAYRGWFVANVPLVLEVPPPDELLAMPAERVFYLDISPERLQALRIVRAEAFKIPREPYTSLSYIEKELLHFRRMCLKQNWNMVDVTGKSVEEAAHEIIVLRGKQG